MARMLVKVRLRLFDDYYFDEAFRVHTRFPHHLKCTPAQEQCPDKRQDRSHYKSGFDLDLSVHSRAGWRFGEHTVDSKRHRSTLANVQLSTHGFEYLHAPF